MVESYAEWPIDSPQHSVNRYMLNDRGWAYWPKQSRTASGLLRYMHYGR